MVKTTCRLRMTWLVNHLYSSSWESSIRPSFWAPSLHCVIRVAYSSPSKRPGTWETQWYPGLRGLGARHHGTRPAAACQGVITSPLASRVFIRSRNPESSTLDSSMMNAIFSFLQPERRSTVRRSSSKSSPVYFLWTCGSGAGQPRPRSKSCVHEQGATVGIKGLWPDPP